MGTMIKLEKIGGKKDGRIVKPSLYHASSKGGIPLSCTHIRRRKNKEKREYKHRPIYSQDFNMNEFQGRTFFSCAGNVIFSSDSCLSCSTVARSHEKVEQGEE